MRIDLEPTDEELYERGFFSREEYNAMLAKITAGGSLAIGSFCKWMREDGTKAGLLKILRIFK